MRRGKERGKKRGRWGRGVHKSGVQTEGAEISHWKIQGVGDGRRMK